MDKCYVTQWFGFVNNVYFLFLFSAWEKCGSERWKCKDFFFKLGYLQNIFEILNSINHNNKQWSDGCNIKKKTATNQKYLVLMLFFLLCINYILAAIIFFHLLRLKLIKLMCKMLLNHVFFFKLMVVIHIKIHDDF